MRRSDDLTWKTAGQLVRECVARLERKGLGTVAESAPNQVRAGEVASQTVDGGSRVVQISGRAFLCFAAYIPKRAGNDLTLLIGSTGMFPRISARDAGGKCQPVILVIFHDLGPHLRAAAWVAQEGQRSGE